MKVAVVVPAAGSPGTLATTAFTAALMEGFSAIHVESRALGLTLDRAEWVPDALGVRAVSAPWLPPISYRLGDRAEASRRGIFDRTGCLESHGTIRWRMELLLERDLIDFAPEGRDHVLLVDSRALLLVRTACRVARRLGWKVVVVSSEALTNVRIDAATRDDYIRCVTRCASGIWAFSEHLAGFWKSHGVTEDRIFVSPPVVRPSSFLEEQPPSGRARAAYLGNLAHREIEYLLDISALVARAVPDFRLTIHGDATDTARHNVERAVEDRDLDETIIVSPPVPPADVARVLSEADVLLLPRSRGEFSTAGFPNKLGEYLASGRPVVSTIVGDIPKYLSNGKSAFLVEPDDNGAFAAAVVRVLSSPDAGASVGAEGRRVAERALRADVVAERLVSFAESLEGAPECPTAAGGTSLANWLRDRTPDPDLTRRDASLLLRALLRKPR